MEFTENISYNSKINKEITYFIKADIESILPSHFIFVWKFLLQMTPHTRDIAVQRFPTEQRYPLMFFVFKDTSGSDVPIPVQESGREPYNVT
jgi:hypothetical protein